MRKREVATDRRLRHRVPLTLPIRLRWAGPFGQTIEVSRTRDVSRSGVLVECSQSHPPGTSLWVTFPYDPSLPEDPSEIPARVVREEPADASRRLLGMELVSSRRPAPGGDGVRLPGRQAGKTGEQRSSPRRPMSVPVLVRLFGVPWYEEAMTLDLSFDGMRLLSTRLYEPGNHVYVSFRAGTQPSPWNSGRETLALVVRVDPDPRTNRLVVAVSRLE